MHSRRTETPDSGDSRPSLAARTSSSSTRERSSSATNTSAKPRYSHRSRAGCWTCRGRKVKCDEAHPRCGPCTRLNKVCDWDQRWNFSDATVTTQNRHNNVSTAGNAVWDVNARVINHSPPIAISPGHDILPSFADLVSDEERERKAVTAAPGTFNVIVNPDSFSSVPEYASSVDSSQSRRVSSHSLQSSSMDSFSSEASRTLSSDPNTVVLTRFEDAAPTLPSFLASSMDRRGSLPGGLQQLELSTSASASTSLSSERDFTGYMEQDLHLVRHFEEFICPRILPISTYHFEAGARKAQNPIVSVSRTFPPLHHAICAISLLSLHFKGKARWEDALERDMQATRLLQRNVTSDNDLVSDGVYFVHYLLLIYDISSPVDQDNLWHQHLRQLLRVATCRSTQPLTETHQWILGSALAIDTLAGLAGMGSCGFMRAELQTHFVKLDAIVPVSTYRTAPTDCFTHQEAEHLPSMIRFSYDGLVLMGKLSQLALHIRSQVPSPRSATQIMVARSNAIAQLQTELYRYWANSYPQFLARDSPAAANHLSPRLRMLFERGYYYFSISIIYSNLCMFPGQIISNRAVRAEVEQHCNNILNITTSTIEECGHGAFVTVFATFLAGCATSKTDTKVRAINLIRAMEGRGISRNATKARELLFAVCEEQRKCLLAGGMAEEVDWITLAKMRGMGLVAFGL